MRSGSGLHLHFDAVFRPGHCAQQRHGLDTRPGQLDTLPIVSRCFWGVTWVVATFFSRVSWSC